jgi:hypothetical protein
MRTRGTKLSTTIVDEFDNWLTTYLLPTRRWDSKIITPTLLIPVNARGRTPRSAASSLVNASMGYSMLIPKHKMKKRKKDLVGSTQHDWGGKI